MQHGEYRSRYFGSTPLRQQWVFVILLMALTFPISLAVLLSMWLDDRDINLGKIMTKPFRRLIH